MTDGDALDTEATFRHFLSVVEHQPDATALALRLWDRLDPGHWALEWHLPLWLGDAFGLDRAVSQVLVTSNVLGLASVRLADDLVDGEVVDGEIDVAATLSRAFYDAARSAYVDLFPASSTFWARLGRWMSEWRTAGIRPDQRLARRGAPLKISAFAVCDLSGQGGRFGEVEACLEHALTAMALYDDACDWRADLAAGRWNAFIAESRDRRHWAADRLHDEATLLAAMMSGRPIARYFARIDRELGQAAGLAGRLGVDGLARHLEALRRTLRREAEVRERRHARLGDAAVALVFG